MGRKKCMWKNTKCKDLIGEDQRFLSAGVGDRTGHNWGYFVYECVSVWVCMCVRVSDTAWLHHTDATAQHCGVHESSIPLISSSVPSFSFTFTSVLCCSHSLGLVISRCPIEGDVSLHFATAGPVVIFSEMSHTINCPSFSPQPKFQMIWAQKPIN